MRIYQELSGAIRKCLTSCDTFLKAEHAEPERDQNLKESKPEPGLKLSSLARS